MSREPEKTVMSILEYSMQEKEYEDIPVYCMFVIRSYGSPFDTVF